MRLQHAQRQGAVAQHAVVEGADVEGLDQLLLGVGAELLDLELTDLVGQRLTRPDDVAIDLDDDVVLLLAGVRDEVVDGLLSASLQVVHRGLRLSKLDSAARSWPQCAWQRATPTP